jgi:hypothetical protein
MNRSLQQVLLSQRLFAQQIAEQSTEALRAEERDNIRIERVFEAACRGQTSRHIIPYRDPRDRGMG